MVSKKEIQKKYTDLKNRIFELNESYHRHDVSEVSDEKYDSLFKELIDFEEEIATAFNNKEIRAPIHLHGNNENQLIKIFKSMS